jgi:nucleoside 2-deoxyribosyltransferase
VKIYLATSWRNRNYRLVRSAFIHSGFKVYDFKNPDTAFSWKQIDVTYPWSISILKKCVRHHLAARGFNADSAAIRECDAFVLLLPCGRSAHWELGFAEGLGKPTYVLCIDDDEIEPEVVYHPCKLITGSLEKLVNTLKREQT